MRCYPTDICALFFSILFLAFCLFVSFLHITQYYRLGMCKWYSLVSSCCVCDYDANMHTYTDTSHWRLTHYVKYWKGTVNVYEFEHNLNIPTWISCQISLSNKFAFRAVVLAQPEINKKSFNFKETICKLDRTIKSNPYVLT